MSMTSKQAEALLRPSINEYIAKLDSGDLAALEAFYHPNSTMIETDKSCLWGKKDIGKSLLQMTTEFGKTTMTVSGEKFEGVGDFIMFETDFAFHTEKAGDLNGHYLQIWRLHNGKYVIYHDEYALN